MGDVMNDLHTPAEIRERREFTARQARDRLGEWLSIHPKTLAPVERAPVEALMTLIDALGFSAEHGSAQVRELMDLRERVSSLELMVRRDVLTGIANRRAFVERLDAEWERARRYERPLSLVTVDIDNLKTINDTQGHLAGDAVIREVATRLTNVVRAGDVVSRVGGDEFIVICPEADVDSARQVAAKLEEQVREQAVQYEGGHLAASISVGWAVASAALDRDHLIALADAELYRAKSRRHRLTPN